MNVPVDEAGQHGDAVKLDHHGVRSGESVDFVGGPNGYETAIPDGQRFGDWSPGVGGVDVAAHGDGSAGTVGLPAPEQAATTVATKRRTVEPSDVARARRR